MFDYRGDALIADYGHNRIQALVNAVGIMLPAISPLGGHQRCRPTRRRTSAINRDFGEADRRGSSTRRLSRAAALTVKRSACGCCFRSRGQHADIVGEVRAIMIIACVCP